MDRDRSSVRRTSRRRRIIIVAPPELLAVLARASAAYGDVVSFENLEELDRWRLRQGTRSGETIGPDLATALTEAACTYGALPSQLRAVFDALSMKTTTPTVQDIQEHWPSRRSLYRVWRAAIPMPPSAFLRRVRILHAARLLAIGLAPKEAAHAAGFSSADRMRRVQRKPPAP